MPKISVLMPSYNRPVYIRQTIDSCLEQDFQDFEILVGDDSTTDEVGVVMTKYYFPFLGKKILYTRNLPRLGQTKNIDVLIRKATGENIMILHDDDYLFPGAFSALIACLDNNPSVIASFGTVRVVNDDGEYMEKQTQEALERICRTKEYEGTKLLPILSAIYQQFPINAMLVRAAYAKAVGYDYEDKCGDACDFYFGWNLAQFNLPFYFKFQETSAYRITKQSISTGHHADHGFVNGPYYRSKIMEDETPPELMEIPKVRETFFNSLKVGMITAIRLKKYKDGWRWFFLCLSKGRMFSFQGIRCFVSMSIRMILNFVYALKSRLGS